ncbi:MAG: hypothetical protein GFGODING_01374 [Flavobacteriales bacterium]|nr:hypothetical protein [Flavobacteriales bacterium]
MMAPYSPFLRCTGARRFVTGMVTIRDVILGE